MTIENFRGVASLDLSLDSTTAIIGENNHGKTSIFDVLGLLLGRPDQTSPRHFRFDDFHRPGGAEPPRPIRVALTFRADGLDEAEEPTDPYQAAVTQDADGERRVRIEFGGEPESPGVTHRFLDEDGESLDPQPPDGTLDAFRRLHPVLLVRFAQPAGPVAEARPEEVPGGKRRGRRGLEAQVARVYRDLARARGPVPAETIREGLEAARGLAARLTRDGVPNRDPLRRMLEELVADPGYGRSYDPAEHAAARAGSGSHTLGLLMVLGALLDVRGDELLAPGAHPIIALEEPEVHLHPTLLASAWSVIDSLKAQTVVTTYSGELLSEVPIRHLRRLVRRPDRIEVYRVAPGDLSASDERRVGYHIRAKRGGVLFARCWILVEGETEFWLIRQLAEVLGFDLESEGIHVVEFAQCGAQPLLRVANALGIEWHLLADGDEPGAMYRREALGELNGEPEAERVSRIAEPDIEGCLWRHGYADVYRKAARMEDGRDGRGRPASIGKVIAKAARLTSKPWLALTVAEECARRGPEGVPPVIRRVIETSVALARAAVTDGAEALRL